MVLKRQFHEEGDENLEFPVPESKRRPTFRNVVRDVMRDVASNEVAWEHFFRRVVREEVERVILPYLNSSPRTLLEPGTSASGGSGLQLHFYNKLPSTIFTGSRVEAEDATPLQIVLIDASTKAVVRSGPLSSLKLEIMALNGEFGSDDKEDWTDKDFNQYIVRERDGKRPLVTGELNVTLKDGVASLGDIVFTDNSSWIRNRRFRLAARAKTPTDVRIREARSMPFMVKDHRGELYRKHHPPSLDDEIWRLEKIAKEGAFHKRLSSYRINTVKDFLQWYVKDPSGLRNVFGGVSNRTWNTIIEHATDCVVDDQKYYAYHRHEQDVSLVFNSIYKVVGAILNGQYCSLDELNTHHKILLENLKQHAYRNERDMVVIDPSDIFGPSRALSSLQADSFNGSNQDLQQIEFPFIQQDEPAAIQPGFNHASTSTSYQTETSNQIMVSLAQAGVPMQAFNPALPNSLSIDDFSAIQYNGESSTWPLLSGLQGSIVPNGHLGTENMWSPPNGVWGQTNTFCFGSTSDTEAGHFAHIPTFVHNTGTRRRPKACWCKLRAAIKWCLSSRRDVAAKRMARPLYLNY